MKVISKHLNSCSSLHLSQAVDDSEGGSKDKTDLIIGNC